MRWVTSNKPNGGSGGEQERYRRDRAIVRRVPEDIATDSNLHLIEDVFAEDAVEHGPLLQGAEGIDEIRAAHERFLDAFPDFSVTVEDTVTQGDTVAMRVTARGTHEGEFMGMEPTNESFEIQNMIFTRIEDGKIVERWVQPDMLGLLRQLDIISAPEGMPGR